MADVIIYIVGVFSKIPNATLSLKYQVCGVIVIVFSAVVIIMMVIRLKRKPLIVIPYLCAIVLLIGSSAFMGIYATPAKGTLTYDINAGKITIENIEMININITAKATTTIYVGAVLGYSENGSDSILGNCKADNVTINVTTEKDAYVGTISGKCIADISGISGSGNISVNTNKEAYVGGLIGCTSVESTINNAVFEGNIKVTSKIDSSTSISDIFVGGLFGYVNRLTINNANVSSNITVDCINTGDVAVGGLIGYSSAASVTDGIKVNKASVVGNITIENANNVIAAGLVTSSGKVTDASYKGEVKIYATDEVDFVGISNGNSVEKSYVNSTILIETAGYISSIGITSNRAKNCYFNGTMELKSDYKVFASGILGEGDYAINCYSTGNINIIAGYKYTYSVVATGIALGYNSAPDIQNCFTDLCIVAKNSNSDSYIIGRVSHRCDEFIIY